MYTNVLQKIQPSIPAEDFVFGLMSSEGNIEMLMHNTIERILRDFNAYMSIEDSCPAFPKAVGLMHELYAYGFKKEAHECLNEMAKVIIELYSNMIPWFRMQTKLFDGYTLPAELQYKKEEKLFGNHDIYIEEHREINGIVHFTFCIKGTENDKGTDWQDGAIATQDLIEFAIRTNMCEATTDTSDHTGEHVQRTHKIPVTHLVTDSIEAVIKAFVKAGEDFVVL